MEKARSILSYSLFGLTALDLVGELLLGCFGYNFELTSVIAFAFILALLSVTTVVISILAKDETESKVPGIVSILILLLSLVNVFQYPLKCSSILVLVCVTVTFACALFLALGQGKRLGIQVVILVLSAILSLPIGVCGFIARLFGDIGYVAVVQTVVSPNGEYRAEVLDVNQGAMGGDTVVNVHKNNRHFNLLLFTVSKVPQTVYTGPWGEFEDIQLHWKDEHCLAINHTEYNIQ